MNKVAQEGQQILTAAQKLLKTGKKIIDKRRKKVCECCKCHLLSIFASTYEIFRKNKDDKINLSNRKEVQEQESVGMKDDIKWKVEYEKKIEKMQKYIQRLHNELLEKMKFKAIKRKHKSVLMMRRSL